MDGIGLAVCGLRTQLPLPLVLMLELGLVTGHYHNRKKCYAVPLYGEAGEDIDVVQAALANMHTGIKLRSCVWRLVR